MHLVELPKYRRTVLEIVGNEQPEIQSDQNGKRIAEAGERACGHGLGDGPGQALQPFRRGVRRHWNPNDNGNQAKGPKQVVDHLVLVVDDRRLVAIDGLWQTESEKLVPDRMPLR